MSGYFRLYRLFLPRCDGRMGGDSGYDVLIGRQAVSISGDGGFGQYLADFTTAVKYDMNITHILLNNHQLGKITKEQRAAAWDVWQTSLHNPDFAAYAQLCGAFGKRVEQAEDLDKVISAALQHDGAALVEIIPDPNLI